MTNFSMATIIGLEDYDIKKNKGYLAICQKIDTTDIERKKICLIGDKDKCFQQEEREFCLQSFFLLYDLSSDSLKMEHRQFKGSCHSETNKLVFLVVDSTSVIATEYTYHYSYDMSSRLINMTNRWNLTWEWKLESVQYLLGQKKFSNPYAFETKKIENKNMKQIKSELKIYSPNSDIWGIGLIRGYKDSTLNGKKTCILMLDSLNTSNKFGVHQNLYYLPERCQLNRNLFKYINLFASKTDFGMQIDSITSPMDQILTTKNIIDISFGVKAHDEIRKIIPHEFSLDELYYVGIFELFTVNDIWQEKQKIIPKAHWDSLYSIQQDYNKKIEDLKRIDRQNKIQGIND